MVKKTLLVFEMKDRQVTWRIQGEIRDKDLDRERKRQTDRQRKRGKRQTDRQ